MLFTEFISHTLNNLLAGTGIGTIFVDLKLRILRYTPTITKIVNLIQGDIGRPMADIASSLIGYDAMVGDTKTVLDTLIPVAKDVLTADGKYFSMNIMPYRTLDNVIMGAVITFVDVTELKKLQATVQELEARNRSDNQGL